MRRYLCILLLFLVSASLYAEQPSTFLDAPPDPDGSILTTLTSSKTRSLIALDGLWEFSEDGEKWVPVTVPSCYMESGHFFLRRSFKVPKSMLDQRRWDLVGFGLQYSGSITLNGSFIVQREGLVPFRAAVPDEVEMRETNTIVIEIDNRLDYSSTLPGRRMPLDVRTYGGVLRNLLLVGTPRVWIDEIRVLRGADGTVAFDVDLITGSIKGMRLGSGVDSTGRSTGGRISEERAGFEVSISLEAPPVADTLEPVRYGTVQKSIELQSKRTETTRLVIEGGLQSLWSPENPSLYNAIVEVRYNGTLVDERPIRFARRSVERNGSKILLNDSAVTLKGVVYIEDSRKYGASLPYTMMREDMQQIKDMGANLVRFTGGVPHPYLLSICDELGLMAFVDVPIGSSPSSFFDNDDIVERSLARVDATIAATRRFSSVIGYGIGFPVGFQSDASIPLLRALRTRVDSLAPGALLYSVSNDWDSEELIDLVDIVGISQLDGSVLDLAEMLRRALAQAGGKRPVMVLGFGRLVELGNQGGYSDELSSQAQARYITDVVTLLDREDVAGYLYWAFNDYRTDRPLLTVPNRDQYIVSSGLLTLDREMRIAGKTLTAEYTDQRLPDLATGEYSAPSTLLFIAVGIICAIVFLLLINNSRRFRENVFRALLRPYNFYADIRDQRILSTVQTTVLALVIAATFAVIFVSLFYFYRLDESFDFMLSAIVSSDGLKEVLNYLIWRPALAILSFTGLFVVLLFGVAALIRLASLFVRNRIFLSDAYTISVWGALPVLLLIPVAMVLYRILELPGAGPVAFTIVLMVLFWMLYRVLRGAAVIFDVPATKVYLFGIGGLFTIFLILYFTSSNVSAMASYLLDGVGSLYGFG